MSLIHRVIHLDKSQGLIKIPLGRSSGGAGNVRAQSIDSLYFNERTVSKIHGFIEINFGQISAQGYPSLVFIDNGSQHGVVWNDKRLPKHTRFSLKNNEFVGLVDLLNKNQSHKSVFDENDESNVDYDTVYYSPDKSWPKASVKHTKIKLQISIVKNDSDNFDLIVDQIDHLPSSNENDTLITKSLKQDNIDGSISSAVEEVFEQSKDFDGDSSYDVELEEPKSERGADKTLDIPDLTQDESIVSENDLIRFSDSEISEDDEEINSNNLHFKDLKRTFDEIDDSLSEEKSDEISESEAISSEVSINISLDSGSDFEDDVSIQQPPAKKQKTTGNNQVTMHLLSGFAGLIFGAGLTFFGLASMGELPIENAI